MSILPIKNTGLGQKKSYLIGLVAILSLSSGMGFCGSGDGREDKLKQVLITAAEIPVDNVSQRLGPHPSDPKFAAFKAKRELAAEEERLRSEIDSDTKQRIRSLLLER